MSLSYLILTYLMMIMDLALAVLSDTSHAFDFGIVLASGLFECMLHYTQLRLRLGTFRV